MIISWPARIANKGALRSQFHHVIDIAPTMLDVAGVRAPDVLNGIAQRADRGRQHGIHVGVLPFAPLNTLSILHDSEPFRCGRTVHRISTAGSSNVLGAVLIPGQ